MISWASRVARRSTVAAEQREYWAGKLAGLPEDSGLRPDFPRPPLPSGDGESVTFSIDAVTRAKLAERCRELGVTEFMALQAAVAVVLHKAGSGVDIPLGTPVAGRSEAELDQLIGFFVNILVLRNDLRRQPHAARRADPVARDRVGRLRPSGPAVRPGGRQRQPGAIAVPKPAVSGHRPCPRPPSGDPCRRIGAATAATPRTRCARRWIPVFDMAHADLSVNFFGTDGIRRHPVPQAIAATLIFRTELYRRNTIEQTGRLADSRRHRVCQRHRPEFAGRGAGRRGRNNNGS